MKRCVLVFIGSILLFPVPIRSQGAERLSAEEVLTGYERSLSALQVRVAFDVENEVLFEGDVPPNTYNSWVLQCPPYPFSPHF